MNTIEQRVKDALMWCDDPGITNAILALAREVSRLEEIVYLEDQVNASVQSRDVPDDGLYRRLETLRRECGEGETGSGHGAIADLCTELDEWRESMTDEQFTNVLARWGFVPKAKLDVVNADYRRAVAEGAAMAEKLSQSEDRLMDARKQVKEMEAAAALGRVIRDLRPRKGHRRVELTVTNDSEGPWATTRFAVRWQTGRGWDGTVGVHYNVSAAIAEYNERKD